MLLPLRHYKGVCHLEELLGKVMWCIRCLHTHQIRWLHHKNQRRGCLHHIKMMVMKIIPATKMSKDQPIQMFQQATIYKDAMESQS
uniref:Uncharacterized protein n=1 Tax=Arundo donax TaxID=35708 RepID=A0A0A9E1K7_ARUDO